MLRTAHPLLICTTLALAPSITLVASVLPATPADAHALHLADTTLAKLTLEQKVGLLAGAGTMHLAAQPASGIPELWFTDGPHNIRAELSPDSFAHAGRTDDHSTSLPSLSALAATWDVSLARRFGETLGREARDRGKDILLGPGVNLARTPLNGRNWEYLGEDPVLAARLAVAYVRGVQSLDVAACVKHFAANDQELNRHGVDVVMDDRTLHELYLVPFEAAVREGGALAVMSGYNRFRGVHCSHSDLLNNQILRQRWGFPGFVVSDWGGVHDTIDAALGGTDIEMNAGKAIRYFRQPLVDAVREGRGPAALIDDKARRVLFVMARLGLLDGRQRARGARNTPEHQTFAREVAERAIVLLKNDKALLPLDRAKVKKLLVVGANATAEHCTSGYSAEGKPPYETSPLEGLRALLGDSVRIDHIPGPFTETFAPIPETAVETIDSANLTQGVAVKGWTAAFFSSQNFSGAPLANAFHRQPDFDWRNTSPQAGVTAGAYAARWTTEITAPETGEYLLNIFHDGRARVSVDREVVLDAWTPGALRDSRGTVKLERGRRYTVTAEFAPAAGQGRFSLGWRPPSRIPLTPAQLVPRAKDAETVLFFTGNRHGHGRAQECEGGDRPDLSLSEGDDAAIAAVLAAQPRTIVINLSGSPVAMPWIEQAPTVVQYWFSGMEGGSALGRVLFGAVNPSGKLPMTFPRQLADSPAHALGNYGPKHVEYAEGLLIGHRWHDAKGIAPLFPFGHGLSYTSFAYTDLNARRTGPAAFTVTLTVKNTGKVAGDEIIQLYLEPNQPRLPRPVRELKAFARVAALAPGESRTVELELGPRAFSCYDVAQADWFVESGRYTLRAAASSRDLRAKVEVVVE